MQNWNNKLNCDYYTSIRPAWESYYKKGEFYAALLNSKFHHEAQILEIKSFLIKDLNQYMSFLDAGLSPEQLRDHIKQMYKNKPAVLSESFYFILFKKIK
jgi:hypothetical protein